MKKDRLILGGLRVLIGWTFLWPFFDKLFGLGFSTEPGKAWIDGVSPTVGFLTFGTQGPFAEMFQSLAGNQFVDWLFMVGLLLIGASLVLGIGIKIATWSGAIMLFLMWLAVLPPEHNPIIDEHIIYIAVLKLFFFSNAGEALGLGRWWGKTSIVKRFSFLK
jgi:thiosulfate dehydrogenase [quinone] large subunit